MTGYIKLYRKVQQHWIYDEKRKFSKYEAWTDLLMMANYKDKKIILGNELIDIEKGQVITSELKLMERWDWGKAKLRSFLEVLEKDGMIVKKSDRKKTAITICNYSLYHENETTNRPQADHEQTASRPPADTTKKEKKENKEKKEKKKQYADTVFLTEQEYDRLVKDFGKELINDYIERLDEWQTNNPKKTKTDHNKTIRTWIKKHNATIKPKTTVSDIDEFDLEE